jgi:hypothetical protein
VHVFSGQVAQREQRFQSRHPAARYQDAKS